MWDDHQGKHSGHRKNRRMNHLRRAATCGGFTHCPPMESWVQTPSRAPGTTTNVACCCPQKGSLYLVISMARRTTKSRGKGFEKGEESDVSVGTGARNEREENREARVGSNMVFVGNFVEKIREEIVVICSPNSPKKSLLFLFKGPQKKLFPCFFFPSDEDARHF